MLRGADSHARCIERRSQDRQQSFGFWQQAKRPHAAKVNEHKRLLLPRLQLMLPWLDLMRPWLKLRLPWL